MGKYTSKVVEIKFNLGHTAGSSAEQLTDNLSKDYSGWEVVNIIPNQVNTLRKIGYGLVSLFTLGFYAPSGGYAVIIRKAEN